MLAELGAFIGSAPAFNAPARQPNTCAEFRQVSAEGPYRRNNGSWFRNARGRPQKCD